LRLRLRRPAAVRAPFAHNHGNRVGIQYAIGHIKAARSIIIKPVSGPNGVKGLQFNTAEAAVYSNQIIRQIGRKLKAAIRVYRDQPLGCFARIQQKLMEALVKRSRHKG
jgi:hypothetical protein